MGHFGCWHSGNSILKAFPTVKCPGWSENVHCLSLRNLLLDDGCGLGLGQVRLVAGQDLPRGQEVVNAEGRGQRLGGGREARLPGVRGRRVLGLLLALAVVADHVDLVLEDGLVVAALAAVPRGLPLLPQLRDLHHDPLRLQLLLLLLKLQHKQTLFTFASSVFVHYLIFIVATKSLFCQRCAAELTT